MGFLRLYLSEVTGLGLVLCILLAAAAIAVRYFPAWRMTIRTIRNVGIAVMAAAITASLVSSLVLNQTNRGRIDRTAVDQDQKAFERRHADQTK